MTNFFIFSREESSYPSSSYNYSPDSFFPEYPWDKKEISPEKNHVYEMVRNCLIGLKLDENNYNRKEWNPFGEFIKEGDTVVIKPNWVMHYNKNKRIKENSLECLITHPSIVRVVIDYCLISLNGTGKIIIGDSPMQGCDLEKLIESSGYSELFRFYNEKSVAISPIDFRHYSTLVNEKKVLTGRRYTEAEGIEVAMNAVSKFNNFDASKKRYKVSDYNENITSEFHHDGKHNYLINKDVLSADVIINLCKPKCHRLSGITAAIKNIVGITFDKACLPHRTIGSKLTGGDEYLNNSIVKRMISEVLNRKINFEEQNRLKLSLLMRYTYGVLYYIMKSTSKDKYLLGSWQGNDTIWRTVLDLYYILLYSDKSGILQESKQRRIFNIGDMIISGERNGPVSPEPKHIGAILTGFDAAIFDRVVCELMGFDYNKIPTVLNSLQDKKICSEDIKTFRCNSNNAMLDEKSIDDIQFPRAWRFKPYDSWKGHIEKRD